MRTVFVFISGMTTFTCFGGAVGFFGSGLTAVGVGGGGGAIAAGLAGTAVAACLAGKALACLAAITVAGAEGVLTGGCVLDTEGVEVGFPASWTFPDPIDTFDCETVGLDIWETVAFLTGGGVGRFAEEDGTTFLARAWQYS